MEFKPTNQTYVFEPITTPNKNIQSYFMRNEQSFLVPDECKFINISTFDRPITFLLSNDKFYIDNEVIEHDFIKDDRFNVSKYGTIQVCIDGIYNIINTIIKRKNINQEANKDNSNNITTSRSNEITNFNKEANKDNVTDFNEKIDKKEDKFFTKNNPVILIVSDFMGRSDTIALIRLIINSFGFKAIMTLPISLCLSFNLKHPYAAFVYKNGFSYIEDFCLVDAYEKTIRAEPYPKIRNDDEDFAEEYSRLNLLDDKNIFSCLECGLKDETEEKILSHISKDHPGASFIKYERSDEFDNCFKSRMRYLFKNESYEKISKKVYSIGFEFDEAENITNVYEMAVNGALLFSTLEIAKEVWMTDYEWRVAGLRLLKEKMLYFI